MNLAEFKATWFANASWPEVEVWPLRTRRIAMGAGLLLSSVVSAVVLAWPAYGAYSKAVERRSASQANLATAQTLIAGLPAQRNALRELKAGAKDPMESTAILASLESTSTSAVEGDGGFTVEGEGDATALAAWVESLIASNAPALVRWKSLHVSRSTSTESSLIWSGLLSRLDVTVAPAPSEAVTEAHAQSMGRDPFLALNAVVSEPTVIAEVAETLPSEETWPKPKITEWPLAQLRMVGVLFDPKPVRGLVMGGAKSLYEVRVGDRVGREGKSVQSVSARELRLNGAALSLGPVILEKSP